MTGEAREAAHSVSTRIRTRGAAPLAKVCLLSGGETTVAVTGTGKGGRNQELALAVVDRWRIRPRRRGERRHRRR